MRLPVFVAFAVLALIGTGCSIQDEPTGQANPDATSTTSTPTAVESTTTAAPPSSKAVITIGPAMYELDAVCVAGGAGELVVTGTGFDVNGVPTVALINAFERAPYVSLRVGEGDGAVLFEPAVESHLVLELTERGVVGSGIDFVSDLDLETGEATPGGVGAVEVDCLRYERELPPELLE